MFRAGVFCAALVMLSGCGTAYISSEVIAKEDGSVEVIPLTPASVSLANKQSYVPRSLPAAFFQSAGAGASGIGAGTLPDPSLDKPVKPAALETRIPPAVPKAPYQIGVGDVVLLATKSGRDSVEQLTGLLAAQSRRQGYTVQDDGSIAIPDVGRVQLAGLTLKEAEDSVFQALVSNQIDPIFSLEIAEFNSKKVAIGGTVSNPTVAPITLTGLKLDEALAAAGGVTTGDLEFASIRIYREGTLYQIPLSEYLRRPELQKARLAPGDSIFVDKAYELAKAERYFTEQLSLAQFRQSSRQNALTQLQTEFNLQPAQLAERRSTFQDRVQLDAIDRDYVYLTGEVNKPGRFTMPFGRNASLADALYSEGGFNQTTGNPEQIYVLRGSLHDPAKVTAWHLNARNAANIVMATRMQLRPNDIIFVAEHPVTRWNRVVQQIVPSLITTGVAAATK